MSVCVGSRGCAYDLAPETLWPRIAALWTHTNGAPGVTAGQSDKALAALRQIQGDFDLSEVEIAYIAEYQALNPSRIVKRERPENAFEVVLGVIDGMGLVMPFEHTVVCSAWSLHTYVLKQFIHTPRLLVWSRGSGYGKTVLLSCINELANHSKYMIAPSAAALVRWVWKHPDSTLVIDNAENSRLWDSRDPLRQVYEAGHRQGGEIPRVIRNDVIFFPTFAPLTLGTIIDRDRRDKFPQQIATRSTALEMKKRVEGVDQIFPGDPRFVPVRAVAARWAETFRCPQPQTISLPKELPSRCGDNWRALIAIGDSLGYGATIRAAAVAVEAANFDPEATFYEDILSVYVQRQADGLWTNEIVQALNEMDHGLWAALTNSGFYDRVYRRGIDPRTIWKVGVDGKRRSNKGFAREQFEHVWRELLGHTETQSNKIIRLPRHNRGTREAQDD